MLFPLGRFFDSNTGAIVRKALGAIGVGVISYAAISVAFETALSLARSNYDSIPVDALAIANLAGIGEGLGIIAGAMAFRITFTSGQKLGVLPK